MVEAATTRLQPAAEARTDLSVVVDDVSLTYRIFEDRKPTLRGLVAGRFRPRKHRAIEALRNVSFSVTAGEAIGVIGRNGSGKSTLMRVVAGLLPPTSGAVYARSVPILLGVRQALQPQLSGRRNIYIGGTALGLSRRDIDERIDEIIDFAGLREFIDIPFRAYSSGMSTRLQFAIATAVTPEVLLIDEALAVGDAEFKERSRERIKQIMANAGTVFLVAHGLRAIEDTCSRVLWLNKSRLMMDGPTGEVLDAYRQATGTRRRDDDD